jgi:hypothetical protein
VFEKRVPKHPIKNTVRAAFYALIANADRDKAVMLQDFAIRQCANDDDMRDEFTGMVLLSELLAKILGPPREVKRRYEASLLGPPVARSDSIREFNRTASSLLELGGARLRWKRK